MLLSIFITTIKTLWIIFGIFTLISMSLLVILRNFLPESLKHNRRWNNDKKHFAVFSVGLLNLLLIYILFGMLDFNLIILKLVANINASILSAVVGFLFLFVFYFCIKNGYSIEKLPRIQNNYLKMVALGIIRTTSVFLGLFFLFIPIFYHI